MERRAGSARRGSAPDAPTVRRGYHILLSKIAHNARHSAVASSYRFPGSPLARLARGGRVGHHSRDVTERIARYLGGLLKFPVQPLLPKIAQKPPSSGWQVAGPTLIISDPSVRIALARSLGDRTAFPRSPYSHWMIGPDSDLTSRIPSLSGSGLAS